MDRGLSGRVGVGLSNVSLSRRGGSLLIFGGGVLYVGLGLQLNCWLRDVRYQY